MNIKSINSIDSIENQSNRQNTSGHSTPTTPQSPKIEKRASNDNFGGLNGMEKTEIIQKLINVQKQYVKVSHHDDIIVGTFIIETSRVGSSLQSRVNSEKFQILIFEPKLSFLMKNHRNNN